MKQRTIKQVVSDYVEEIDEEGNRRIKVVTKTTKWFPDESGSRHNPTVSTETSFL